MACPAGLKPVTRQSREPVLYPPELRTLRTGALGQGKEDKAVCKPSTLRRRGGQVARERSPDEAEQEH